MIYILFDLKHILSEIPQMIISKTNIVPPHYLVISFKLSSKFGYLL